MTSRLTAPEVAVLAVVAILGIFLFPAAQGPYSTVHGPATAFRAACAAIRVRLLIVISARTRNGRAPLSPLVSASAANAWEQAFRQFQLIACGSVLRC